MCTVCANATDNAMMCDQCADETPDKMSRAEFDIKYWGVSDWGDVPECTRREFYSDYRVSKHTLDEYVLVTTEYA